MSTEQELAASDMHLYRQGSLGAVEALEAHSVVRIFTGTGRHDFVEVRVHPDGWAEINGYRGLVVRPVASNVVMVRPEVRA